MPISWESIVTPAMAGGLLRTLACGSRSPSTSPVALLAMLAAPLLVLARFASAFRHVNRVEACLPICDHCRYDLTGLPAPWRCPECGRSTRSVFVPGGVITENRTLAELQAVGFGLVTALLLHPAASCERLDAFIRWLQAAGLGRLLGPSRMIFEGQGGASASLWNFFAASVVALPLAPARSLRRAAAIAAGLVCGFYAAFAVSLALEWSRGATLVSPEALAVRSALWAFAASAIIRWIRRKDPTFDQRLLTSAPSPAPRPPGTAWPSVPAMMESPAPAPPP